MTIIVLLALSGEDLQKRFNSAIKNKIVIAFLLFYCMHIIWLFGTEHLQSAILKLKDFKYILYILIFAMVLRHTFIKKIINGFLLAIFFSVIMSFALFFQLPIISLLLLEINPHIYPTFPVPFMLSYTQYGSILGLSAGLSFYLLLSQYKNHTRTTRLFYVIIFLLISANILIVPSRMGYLLYFISITIILLFLYRRYWYGIVFALVVTFTVFFTAGYESSSLFKERINTLWTDLQSLENRNFSTSLGIRTGYYIYAISAIKENFLLGVGTADHAQAAAQKITYVEKNPENANALLHGMQSGHNASLESEYLDITLQFGILGLLVFLNIFYQLVKYQTQNPNMKGVQILLAANMIFLATGSVIFIAADIGKLFILMIALTLNSQETDTL